MCVLCHGLRRFGRAKLVAMGGVCTVLYALGAFRRLFGDYRYKEQAAAGGAQSHKTLCGSTTTREVMAQFDFFGTESCTVFYDMRAGG